MAAAYMFLENLSPHTLNSLLAPYTLDASVKLLALLTPRYQQRPYYGPSNVTEPPNPSILCEYTIIFATVILSLFSFVGCLRVFLICR
jgi:hypothetical protein